MADTALRRDLAGLRASLEEGRRELHTEADTFDDGNRLRFRGQAEGVMLAGMMLDATLGRHPAVHRTETVRIARPRRVARRRGGTP